MINLTTLAEQGSLPDTLVRSGIRKLLRGRLARETANSREEQLEALYSFIEKLCTAPIAVATETANEQHYEVPTELFQLFMGPYLKYSSGFWPVGIRSIADAEKAMLELTCRRAGLADGMEILELGCGWGSLSLWMAEHFPHSKITAVSNSSVQREYIMARGHDNLEVVTADMNDFSASQTYDRVVSVEMFEHMRNWPELLRRIRDWLKDDGRLFLHIFVHRELAYLFNDAGKNNWMAEHFFKEGMMPCENLPLLLNNDLLVERHWRVNGTHYARTLRAWLERIDAECEKAVAILERSHGKQGARRQFGRWRMFFMACEELFNFRKGTEWYVAHYLLHKR